MYLVNAIRRNQEEGKSIEEAVHSAVKDCIENDILKEFLIKHESEVFSMCITEFDEKVFVKGIREEGREEGIKEGINYKGIKVFLNCLERGMDIGNAQEIAEISNELVEEALRQRSI